MEAMTALRNWNRAVRLYSLAGAAGMPGLANMAEVCMKIFDAALQDALERNPA